MELHHGRPPDFEPTDLQTCSLDELFLRAKEYAEEYHEEQLQVYRTVTPASLTPEKFWKEYIWCVYTSGFKASIVTKHYDALLEAYGSWDAPRSSEADWVVVSKYIANRRKYDAVIKCRGLIRAIGWDAFKSGCLNSVETIGSLPFIGMITRHHLARNLGFDTVKPDLHLWRLAIHFRCQDPHSLCQALSTQYHERLGVVDFILWAYCAAFGTSEIHQELL